MNLQSKFLSKNNQYLPTLLIDGTIKASYANFGYVPYGHSIVIYKLF